MSFEFQLPNFQVETRSERNMYSYLYQTVQQLNWAMKHISDNGGVGYSFTAPIIRNTDVNQKDENLCELKDLIIKSADVISAVTATVGKRLQGNYVAKSEFGTYQENTALTLEASDKRIDQNYENIQLINTQMMETSAYIRTGLLGEDADGMSVYGLEIGQTNERNGQTVFRRFARFSSSRLSFFDQNDTEIAYISDYKLYITNAHVTGSLTLGGYEIDTADGLAFRWIGS